MEVNLVQTSCARYAPAFGQKYPYADVMELVSGCHVVGNEKQYSTTLKKMIKQIGVTPDESNLANHLFMRRHIQNAKGFNKLQELAKNFRKAFDATGISQFKLSPKQASEIVNNEAQKYGSKTIDIEFT